MADRISNANVERMFAHWADAFGFRLSKGFNNRTKKNDPGLWLDHNRAYGGYVVVELNDRNTGEHTPFGLERRSAREMYDAFNYAMRSIDYKRRK